MKSSLTLTIATLITLAAPANAACYCACINNSKVKVCENSWDANYVYCPGTYCTSSLDLLPEQPGQETVKERFAALITKPNFPSSKLITLKK